MTETTNEVSNNGEGSLVSKVAQAVEAVRAKIASLDGEIDTLTQARAAIMAPPVSKQDFMEYVREDIRRRSKIFPRMMKVKWANKHPFNNFEKLERLMGGAAGGLQAFPYFTGDLMDEGIKLEPTSFFWYFGDVIEERFEQAIEDFDWPADAMPISERRTRIQEIDSQIANLTARRDLMKSKLRSTLGPFWGG